MNSWNISHPSFKRYGSGSVKINNKWILLGGANQLAHLQDLNDIYQRGRDAPYLKDCIMSVDKGLTWTTICQDIFSNNNTENLNGVFKPRMAYDNKLNLLYFCGGWFRRNNSPSIDGERIIWVSKNQGYNWEKIIPNNNSFMREVLFAFVVFKSNLYIFGGVNIFSNGNLASSTRDVYISYNQGKDFNLLTSMPINEIVDDTTTALMPAFGMGYLLINDKLIIHGGFIITVLIKNPINSRRQTYIYDFNLNEFRNIQIVRNIDDSLGISNFDNITHKQLNLHNEPILSYNENTKIITMITGFFANNYDTIFCANYIDILNTFNENILYPSVLWKKQYGLTDLNGLPSFFGQIRYTNLFSDNSNIYIVFGLNSTIDFNETDYPLIENTINNLEINVNPYIIKLNFVKMNNIYTNSPLLIRDNDSNGSYPPSNHHNPPINGLLNNYQLLLPHYQTNQIYYSKDYLVEFHVGNMPLIITVPHGGYKFISTYPIRNQEDFIFSIETNTDNNTLQLALELKQKIFQSTGKYPYIIISNIPRSQVEFNRHIHQKNNSKSYATNETPLADTWFDFYHFINLSIYLIEKTFTNHIILDLHGHGRDNNDYQMMTPSGLQTIKGDFIHLGYLLSSNNLIQIFNKKITDIKFSTYNLYSKSKLSLYEYFYNNNSFGSFLHQHGLKTFPSNQFNYIDTSISGQTYFTGGAITKIFASSTRLRPNYLNNSNIIQMEFPSSMRRKSVRDNTTTILNNAILQTLIYI